MTEQMDISKMSKNDLLEKCKELGITKCCSKTKPQLIELVNSKHKTSNNTEEYKNILHHLSFETPTLGGVLSDDVDTFSAFEMQKGVKWDILISSWSDTTDNFVNL